MVRDVWTSVLSYLMPALHMSETLTEAECAAQGAMRLRLVRGSATCPPLIVCMVGLVASGKSFVARCIAEAMEATIIEADMIRVELSKQGAGYDKVRMIAEDLAIEFLSCGSGCVVLDSDFIDSAKRASILAKARALRAKVVFIRTHCRLEVALTRVLSADYSDNEFYISAARKLSGKGKQVSSAEVKASEMRRRLLIHYKLAATGEWQLRPVKVDFSVDTTQTGAALHAQIADIVLSLRAT